MGARFRRRVSGFFFRVGRHTVRQVGGGVFVSSLSLHRAARVSCGLMVRHARLTTRRVACRRARLCRPWFCILSSSTERESSAARAHETIGAGRLKRRFGVCSVVVVLRAAWVADAALPGRRRLRVPSRPRRRAARAACGLMVRHARLTTRRVAYRRARLCRPWLCILSSSTERESSAARALTIPPVRVG